MRIRDWSSDVCSSDLQMRAGEGTSGVGLIVAAICHVAIRMMRRPKVMANHFTHHRGPRRWELRAVRMACVSVGTVAVMSTLLRRGRPGEEAALDGAEQDVHEQAEDSCHDDRGVEGEHVVALRAGGGEDAADSAGSADAEFGGEIGRAHV